MAASDPNSSPVLRSLQDRSMALSSSPLPELHELVAKKPKAQALRSGSGAVPIPAGATTAFTSASQLLRAARAPGGDSPNLDNEQASHAPTKAKVNRVTTARTNTRVTKPSKPPRAPKRVPKAVITLSSDDAAPKSPEADSRTEAVTEKEGAEGTKSKAQSWEKSRTTASAGQAPAKLGEADTAKPRTITKTKKKAEEPETVSRHFQKKTTEKAEAPIKEATAKHTRAPSLESINLEPAVERRRDWTPLRPDTLSMQSGPIETAVGVLEGENEEASGDASEDASNVFKQLRDKYGHVEPKAGTIAPSAVRSVQPLGKRKAIELVSVNKPRTTADTDHASSPVKEKAPKKKPRTITEMATAAYRAKTAEPTQDSARDRSLVDHFKLQTAEAAGKASKGKGAKVTKKTKKAAAKQPELLSPRAAMRQSAAQEFVFGTSSQLAREPSPTFLKELHAALRASNRASDVLAPDRPSRGLWSESARDEGGELVDIEVIDLVDSPAFPQDNAILDPWKDLPPDDSTANHETDEADASLLEIGSRIIPIAERRVSQPQLLEPRSVVTPSRITINSAATVSPDPSESSFPPIEDLLDEEMPPPSNQQQSLEEADQTVSPAKVDDHAQPRPQYELFTDAKLSAEISRYGFKVVKSRTAMLSLLDQCWRSKNQAPGAGALFSTTSAAAAPMAKKTAPETDSSSSSAPPAKRPRGKAKNSTAAKATTDDTEAISAPPAKRPRGRPRKVVGTDAVDTEVRAALRSPVRKASSNHDDEPTTPTKKRGRPRKEEAATIVAPPPKPGAPARLPAQIEDSDLDSEEEEDEWGGSEQIFSPVPAEVSISDETEVSLNVDPSDAQSTLFSLITKAVKSAPRTADPSTPSWYEKMLMYDPIILEDLAAWLNSGQLTKVGYDGEVAPDDVKKWCESRSICCLWRVSLRGRERKRF